MQVYAAAIVDNAMRVAQREGAAQVGVPPEAISPAKVFPTLAVACHPPRLGPCAPRHARALPGGVRGGAALGGVAAALEISAELAARCCEELADPTAGPAPDGRLDLEGFRIVLALRAELEGQWGGQPPPPERYYDLAYRERALARPGGGAG